jgi:hypothetical protein
VKPKLKLVRRTSEVRENRTVWIELVKSGKTYFERVMRQDGSEVSWRKTSK